MRRRARSIALARGQRSPGEWLAWLALTAALGLAAISAAHAQTTTPAHPLPPKSDQTGPTVPAPGGTGALEKGVIRPPAAVDPGITKGTPNPQAFPTPIIPPPGSSGGNQRVQPK
ncbi:MAG: hypothetical protein J0H14_26845 [Alphaproteobacteria bacterium]|nr:hypothetical protein [Alphaproteobacteria bacterium]